ncbi:translational activator of cytochrome c oxidase 1-like [Patiria miniata]|uniref:Translational activator of cytochrome c oxidase 1 n=1 Tax=Patiria miniata TaxID=46514 RepID=A0A913Z0C4_PATMI|nr:translational activator of cytochrome c oxidase 1-like [Patiria miniata]XP_038045274.1 translational activator of cytochrome c oxidase 1-like [Patiria miniata]
MASNVLSSIPIRELKQLISICSLRVQQCRYSCWNSKLSHTVNGQTVRFKHIAVSSRKGVTTLNTPQFGAVVRLVELPKLRELCLNDEHFGRPSRNIHQGIPEDRFGSSILGASRQFLRPGSCGPTIHVATRLFHGSGRMWAGHNKWSKVKNIKGPKDNLRSLLFNKLILQMRIAIKDNGPNPELNSTLASLIAQARQKAMTKATIENVLKNTAKNADTRLLLEARGPGQSCLLIDLLTDNARRTRSEIQRILQKNGGDFGTSLYAFTRKGVVKVLPHIEGQESPLTLDLATEVAIEVGAEDVQETNSEDDTPLFMFICDMGDLRTVRNNLASLNYAVESSSFEYLPETSIALNDKNLEDAFHLISLLNDNPNVVKIYDNVESSG